MNIKDTVKKEVTVVIRTGNRITKPENYNARPPIHSVITANRLFSLFTADIIKEDVVFTR